MLAPAICLHGFFGLGIYVHAADTHSKRDMASDAPLPLPQAEAPGKESMLLDNSVAIATETTGTGSASLQQPTAVDSEAPGKESMLLDNSVAVATETTATGAASLQQLTAVDAFIQEYTADRERMQDHLMQAMQISAKMEQNMSQFMSTLQIPCAVKTTNVRKAQVHDPRSNGGKGPRKVSNSLCKHASAPYAASTPQMSKSAITRLKRVIGETIGPTKYHFLMHLTPKTKQQKWSRYYNRFVRDLLPPILEDDKTNTMTCKQILAGCVFAPWKQEIETYMKTTLNITDEFKQRYYSLVQSFFAEIFEAGIKWDNTIPPDSDKDGIDMEIEHIQKLLRKHHVLEPEDDEEMQHEHVNVDRTGDETESDSSAGEDPQTPVTPRSDSSVEEDPPTPVTPRSDAAGDSGIGSGMNSPNAVTPDREGLDMSHFDECYNSDSSDGDD